MKGQRDPLAHFLDVHREGQITALEATAEGLFQHSHHPPGGLLLDLERASLADQQVDVDKRIVRVAVGDAIVRDVGSRGS